MAEKKNNSITSGLNESQIRAVTFGDGPLLVVAGAGSGKTRVITHRMAYLISKGVEPGRILGITFTNKAAAEMARRVDALAGAGVVVKTFHAFCAMLLRRRIQHLDRDNSFSIYDRRDSLRVVKRVCESLKLDPQYYRPVDMLDRISAHKDRLELPDEAAREAVGDWDQQAAHVYERYESELAQNNALDFDDLLLKTVQLFNTSPDVLASCQRWYRHLLVDEYQDTNQAQHVIARALQGGSRNITAVGDPDQMIYTWRGARIENILQFEKEFPGAAVIMLERNYRSTANILRAASHAIAFNKLRHEKRLYTEAVGGNPVRIAGHPDAEAEARWVAETIRDILDAGEPKPEIGVLYRTKTQSRDFEMEFSRRGIPCQVVDATSFFERKAVKDIAAYLHLVVNPRDMIALRRVINVPARGIGARTLAAIESASKQAGKPMLAAILDGKSLQGLPTRARKAVDSFAALIRRINEICSSSADIRDAVDSVIDATDYLSAYQGEERAETKELLDSLLSFADQYERENPDSDLAGFMEQSVLASDVDGWRPEPGAVALLTLHSAKGLEFDVVFLAGVENGILPHPRALEERTDMNEEEAMEEERRLFHVGMTRAREKLFISYALERRVWGRMEVTGESPFLMELPNEGVAWDKGLSSAALRPSASGIWRRKERPAERRNRNHNERENGRGVRIKTKGAGTGRPAGKKSAPAGGDRQPGMKIKHSKYGEGVIVGVTDAADRKLLRIEFPEYGVLTIIE